MWIFYLINFKLPFMILIYMRYVNINREKIYKLCSSHSKPTYHHNHHHYEQHQQQQPQQNTWKMRGAQRSMSIDNINFLSSATSTMTKPLNQHHMQAMEDNIEQQFDQHFEQCDMNSSGSGKQRIDYDSPNENQKEDDNDNIIPWKKLLRKTNSRLNLIS